MGAASLPPGFWLCVASFVAFGALGLLALWWLLRRVRLARVAALAANEDGTTIVEFPFALIILVLMSLLTWQLGFMVSAYLVVDYAAFAAVRSAVVQIPRNMSDEEPAHKVQDITLENSEKGEEIQQAAAFVCYPISGTYTEDDSWAAEVPVLQTILQIPGTEQLTEGLSNFQFATRYVYAIRNTEVSLIVAGQDAGERSFAGGELVTVEVRHKFSLRIAIAARIFGSLEAPLGYVTSLRGRSSMLYEGAGEVVPEDAPEGAQP